MFSLSVRMIFNELVDYFIGYPPFPCLLSPPIFEQRVLFFALYILITFQFGADEHFSSHSAKTSQNKMILDISRAADGIYKTQQVVSDLLRYLNRVHLILICFSGFVEIAAFSLIPIYHRYYRLSSAMTRQCVYAFLPYKTRTGRMTASLASTSEHPALLQSNLPAIDSKTFTD